MKIEITPEEINNLCGGALPSYVRERMGLPANCEVVIISNHKPEVNLKALKVFALMAEACYLKSGPLFFENATKQINMIASIKELRTVIPGLSLTDAKTIAVHFLEDL